MNNYSRSEIEVKILDIDVAEIESRLRKIDIRKLFDRVLTRTLIFDHPNLRLRALGKVLRLRQVGDKVFLSIRQGNQNRSTSPFQKVTESEIKLDDFYQAFSLFEGLGFQAFRYQEKKRTGYSYPGGVSIEINEFPKIPPYLEIEADSEEKIKDFLSKINYTMSDTTKISATEVLKKYGLQDVDMIRFPDSDSREII